MEYGTKQREPSGVHLPPGQAVLLTLALGLLGFGVGVTSEGIGGLELGAAGAGWLAAGGVLVGLLVFGGVYLHERRVAGDLGVTVGEFWGVAREMGRGRLPSAPRLHEAARYVALRWRRGLERHRDRRWAYWLLPALYLVNAVLQLLTGAWVLAAVWLVLLLAWPLTLAQVRRQHERLRAVEEQLARSDERLAASLAGGTAASMPQGD